MRSIALVICLATVAGCQTFGSIAADVDEMFRIGQQLRDRCAATGDVDDCRAWRDYQRDESAGQPSWYDFDRALENWERNGPFAS